MTLSDLISSDATNVYLNTDDFAEQVTFYPSGDPSRKSTVTALVIQDDLEGTREAYGDGVVQNHDQGTAIRESVKLEMAASVDVNPLRRPGDLFKLPDGTMLIVRRITGRDSGLQTVLCVKRDDITRRRPVRSG